MKTAGVVENYGHCIYSSVARHQLPLMKTAGVVKNSGHCIYSIGSKCFLDCLSLFHLVSYHNIYIVYIMNHAVDNLWHIFIFCFCH